MRKFLLLLLASIPFALPAQKTAFRYVDGTKLTVAGKSDRVHPDVFYRIDSTDFEGLPARVKQLATNSTGINIVFQTNATSIKIKWTLKQHKILWNMTPLAVNGLDLYGWKDNQWQFVASAKPTGKENVDTFIKNVDGELRHYKIYLPLYTGLETIQIGVDEEAVIRPADPQFLPKKKVVIYGSSITQGASASRPGLAYPSMIERKLNVETFNMGFSGSGKMEIAMADVLGGMEADLYVLDCVPNPSPKQIEERTIPFVKRLRELKPHVPILMVESIFREHGYWDSVIKDRVSQQNGNFKTAYHQLKHQGFEKLFYIPTDQLLKTTHGYTVDGTHLTDVGFKELAERISTSVDAILNVDHHESWKTREVTEGVLWKYQHFNNLFDSRQSVTVLDVNLDNEHIELKIPHVDSGFMKTSAAAMEARAVAAVNGSFFDTQVGGSTVFLKKNGRIINLTRSGFTAYRENAAFTMDPESGIAVVKKPEQGWESLTDIHTVLASGPLLMYNGEAVSQIQQKFNTSRHPRTAVGITADNHLIAVVVDGRSSEAYGMTAEELAAVMQALGCKEAMNLDGGGSSTAWIRKKGIVNYPSDNGKFDHDGERAVATSILFLSK